MKVYIAYNREELEDGICISVLGIFSDYNLAEKTLNERNEAEYQDDIGRYKTQPGLAEYFRNRIEPVILEYELDVPKKYMGGL